MTTQARFGRNYDAKRSLTTAQVEGKTVKIGDAVGFKCDIEQTGTISAIHEVRGFVELTLTSKYGFSGEYIGRQKETIERANDCWFLNR